MAKLEGEQSIPSALLDAYRGALTEKQPDGTSRKRYPYRVPAMQKGKAGVKPHQIVQRARYEMAVALFNRTSEAQRARWYAARPPWSSFLWYYNYFIMSALMDVMGAQPEGAGVISSINHYTFTLPQGAPANVTVAISTIDPTKAMGFLYGAGHNADSGEDPVVWWAWIVYPYIVSINATHVLVKAAETLKVAAGCSVSVIEYI